MGFVKRTILLLALTCIAVGVAVGAVKTLTEPSADDVQRMVYNQKVRQGNFVVVSTDQKMALVLIKLAPAVTQADYPALKKGVEALAGIQSVELLIDGQAPSSIPAGDELRLYVECQLRMHAIPEAPPE